MSDRSQLHKRRKLPSPDLADFSSLTSIWSRSYVRPWIHVSRPTLTFHLNYLWRSGEWAIQWAIQLLLIVITAERGLERTLQTYCVMWIVNDHVPTDPHRPIMQPIWFMCIEMNYMYTKTIERVKWEMSLWNWLTLIMGIIDCITIHRLYSFIIYDKLLRA